MARLVAGGSAAPRAEPSATELIGAALRLSDRILVLGAGGWFGSTLLDLLARVVPASRVLAVASSVRQHDVAGVRWELQQFDRATVAAFTPTVVVNFAALTRERVAIDGVEIFTATNRDLTAKFLQAAGLPSVRAALTVSSGAAVAQPDHPYGRLKAEEETAALGLVTKSRAVVVARAYSLSGPFVRRPHDYAFSDFVLQAKTGTIHIHATRPVYRRYIDVGEYLAVSLWHALDEWSGTIESGGELVEIGELARLVAGAANPPAQVVRPALISDEPAAYASDGASWAAACARTGFSAMSLATQISSSFSPSDPRISRPQ